MQTLWSEPSRWSHRNKWRHKTQPTATHSTTVSLADHPHWYAKSHTNTPSLWFTPPSLQHVLYPIYHKSQLSLMPSLQLIFFLHSCKSPPSSSSSFLLPFSQTSPVLHHHSHSCSLLIVLFLKLSGGIIALCSHDGRIQQETVSPSPPYENYQRGGAGREWQSVLGRKWGFM